MSHQKSPDVKEAETFRFAINLQNFFMLNLLVNSGKWAVSAPASLTSQDDLTAKESALGPLTRTGVALTVGDPSEIDMEYEIPVKVPVRKPD